MTQQTEVKFAFFEGLRFPMRTIKEHWTEFWKLLMSVSVFTALLNTLLGNGVLCGTGREEGASGVFCSTMPELIIISWVVSCFSVAFFLYKWQRIAFDGKSFLPVFEDLSAKKIFKILGFMFFYICMWACIGVGVYYLVKRTPNPNWMVELSVFAGGSFIVMVAFYFILSFVVFVRFLEGKDWRIWRKLFWPMLDNIYPMSVWFMFYSILFLLLFQSVAGTFILHTALRPWLDNLLGGILFYMLFYFMFALYLSSLNYQNKCLDEAEI
jgi:hypothetical protein